MSLQSFLKRFLMVCFCQSFTGPEESHGGCRHNGRVPERPGPGQSELPNYDVDFTPPPSSEEKNQMFYFAQ